jgi:transglutaminase-like putative cysteine protease
MLLLNQLATGQEFHYPVSTIDTSLLRDASAVIRCNEWVIDISSLYTETITMHTVLTILKGQAAEMAIAAIPYNNWSDVDRFEGFVYDADGRLIKKLGKKDIIDKSAIDDELLYSDQRIKVIDPLIAVYPFTVEYFIKQSFHRMLHYPTWQVQDSYHTSVESARLEIRTDEGIFPRYKEMRIQGNAIISVDGKQFKSWEMNKLPAIVDEPLCPPITELSPVIYLEPNTYEVNDYSGNFSSWKAVGEWEASLNQARDTLNTSIHAKVNALIDGVTDKTEKVKRIYKFMQSTCRYVCVTVGISGIQSETAENVARLGYGDCKGLVNYTSALLKAAGIPSYYTLVRAGKNAEEVQEDFPSDRFNHIILCVPMINDTVWLECTNMKMPFGFLGDFTDNRYVLIVTPQGGALTRTPVYPKEQNTSSRVTHLILNETGNATVKIRSIYRGLQVEGKLELPFLSPDEQKKALLRHYDVPGVVFNSMSFTVSGDRIPVIEEKVTADIPRFSTVSGTRMFISMNRFLDTPGKGKRDDHRKYDFIISRPFIDTDTVIVEIPSGYKIENIPLPAELKTPFGRLKSEVKTDRQTLTLYRYSVLEKGRYPANQYNDFVEFMHQVTKQDERKVVIVK